MIRFRRLAIDLLRALKTSNGPVVFGLALSLGVGFGGLLGIGAERGAKTRATVYTSERASRIATELDRELEARRKALSILAVMPSVVAHQGAEGVAFESFRSVYPEFIKVGVAFGRSPSRHSGRHRGPQAYRMTAGKDGVRVFGTLAADWPKTMLADPQRFGTDDRKATTLLVATGGARTPSAAEPVDPRRILAMEDGTSSMVWTDGREYLTSVHRLTRPDRSPTGLTVVSGVPMETLVAHARRAQWAALAFGAFLGLFAGTVAWVGIARSTRRLRTMNLLLEEQVAIRTAELAAAEGSFREIFENVPLGLYQCDPEGRFLRVNPMLAQTLGYESPAALVGSLGSLQAVGDRESRARLMERLVTEGEVRDATTAFVRADGRTVWLAERTRAIRGPSGEVVLIEGAMHDVTSQRELESKLRHMGETDPLTGLLNRRGLEEAIAAAPSPVSFVTLDVDRFKDYNDTYGHPAGDLALQVVAEAIRGNVRESDAAARTGGEEFVVVLPSTGAPGARRVAETLRAAVEACTGLESRLTVSGGVATATSPSEVAEAFAAADRALYMAKEAGRNRIVSNPASMA